MTFERSQISLAAEQNVNQFPGLWSPGAYADHLSEAKSSKPRGKGQNAIMHKLRMYKLQGVPTKSHAFTEFASDSDFRGMHFGGLMKAAEGLAKKGLVKFDGKSIELAEAAVAHRPKAESAMSFLSRGSRTGQLTEASKGDKKGKLVKELEQRKAAGENIRNPGGLARYIGKKKGVIEDVSVSILREDSMVEGRSWSIRYVIKYQASKHLTPGEWRPRKRGQRPGMGKPTDANLAKEIKGLEASFKPGGANEHAGLITIYGAKIVDQQTGETLATYGKSKTEDKSSAAVLREDADSPESATGGFNRHQKLMSPDTRELVLKSRATEIEAFANDRGYDPRIVFAIAEVSSRMGRVPDLRQYGVYGEEAKAIRHFIAGDILNLAIEDTTPSASILTENLYNIHATPGAAPTGSDVDKMAKAIEKAIAPAYKGRYLTVQAQDVFGQAKSIHIRAGNITPAMAGHNVAWHNDLYKFQVIVSGFLKDGSAGPKIEVEQISGHYEKKRMRKKSVKPGKESLMVNHIKKYVAGLMKDAPAPRAEDVAPSASILTEAATLTEAAGKATVKGKVTFTYASGAQPTIVLKLNGIYLAGPRGWTLDPAFDTWKRLVAKHKSLKTVSTGKSKTISTTVEFHKSSNDYKILVYVGGVHLTGYYIDPAFDLWKKLMAKYPQLSNVTESDDGLVEQARGIAQFTELLSYRDDRAAPIDEAKRVPSKILKLTRTLAQEIGITTKVTGKNYQDVIAQAFKKLEARAAKLGDEKRESMLKRIAGVKRVANSMGLVKIAESADVIGGLLVEVSPPGFSGTVKAMKDEHPEIDNAWALAWHMYGQGAKPRRKPEKGKPRYKSPENYAADKKKSEEQDALRSAQARFYETMACRLTQTQTPNSITYFGSNDR